MNRKETWLTAIVLTVGVVFAIGVGIYSFLQAAVTPLYPNAQAVPSSTDGRPVPEWASAAEQARQLARASVVEQNLPGLSIAVGVGGEIVWSEGFGWADLDARVPVAAGTRFRIGHTSKALTSAAVGLLLEQGKVHLDDEIQKYVPAFPRKEWPVTLRQLMGHLAGIRHYRNEVDYMPSAHCERASDALPIFANDPLLFEPETQYKYSTYGWILVSAAVEAVSGQPFFTFMRGQVFDPLGMGDTSPDSATESSQDRTTFYYPKLSGDPYYGPELATTVDYSCFAGAGGFLSTPSDLVRFGMSIGGKLLQPATVKKLQTPQLLASGKETGYGLGWTLETYSLAGQPTPLASHASRTLLGGATSFLTFPERGLVVAVTSNISFANTRPIALTIAQVFAAVDKSRAPQ